MPTPSRTQRLLVATVMVAATALAACTPDQAGPGATPAQPGAAPTGQATAAAEKSTTQVATPAAQAPAATAPTVQPGTPAAQKPTAGTPAPTAVAAVPRATFAAAPSQAGRSSNPAVLVYERNSDSVVNITSLAVLPTTAGPAERPRGNGSGFILDEQGHIVTNNHVIEQADQLAVIFPDRGRTVMPATLVGRDPDNDLAVVRVDPSQQNGEGRPIGDLLEPDTLGDSERVTIGEDAVAMGSPLGLQQTVTAGIVSALRAPGDEPVAALELLGGAVQTDAAVNPGNSGGPLFNAAGEVIGVNTAILSPTGGNIGVGFAIPVNVVKRIVPELIQHGCYRHPLIGVSTVSLARLGQAAKRELGIPLNQAGLLVQEVSAGAQQAGIRAGQRAVNLGGVPLRVGGDIIVAVDGRPIGAGGELRAYIENNKRPGDTVTMTILRDGSRQNVTVQLTEKPSDVCPG